MVLLTVGVNLGVPFVVRFAVDDLNGGSMSFSTLLMYVAVIIGASTTGLFFSFWMRKIPLSVSHEVEYAIRRDLFTRLTSLESDFYRRERTGDIMTKMGVRPAACT